MFLILGFFMIFGVTVIVVTTLVIFVKKEESTWKDDEHHDLTIAQLGELDESIEDKLTIWQTYKTIWHIFCMPAFRLLALVLVTCRVKNSYY